MAKRVWRKPTEEDKVLPKCRARSSFVAKPFYVEWNGAWGCWAVYGRKHILVAVDEILSPKESSHINNELGELK